MKKNIFLSFILLFVFVNQSNASNNYCIALRGNGQQMPAHFGALAKTIEVFGVPQGMAGGSSAALSTFLMESMLLNPFIKGENDPNKKRISLAFMWKLLEGSFLIMSQEPEWKSLALFLNDLSKINDALQSMTGLESVKLSSVNFFRLKKIHSAVLELQKTGLFNGPATQMILAEFQKFKQNPSDEQRNRLVASIEMIKKTLSLLGKFDAQHDEALFLRAGVIDFRALARTYGKLADFLSLNEASATTKDKFLNFLQSCGEDTSGKSWNEIALQKPECVTSLAQLKSLYFSENSKNTNFKSRVSQLIGTDFSAFVTTSIITGKSAQNLQLEKQEYNDSMGSTFQFQKMNPQEVKFGYWGKVENLKKAETVLLNPNTEFGKIDKSTRFKSLGQDTWENILSLSPAEPGLSSVLEYQIPETKENVISAGGWSDLQPVLILKASGCEEVVYVTRQGGESDFVAGVHKRLFEFPNMDWTLFDKENQVYFKGVSNQGTKFLNEKKLLVDPLWKKMLDLNYEKSSVNYSLKEANAIVCTNWSDFDVTKEFKKLVADGYQAPIYHSKSRPLATYEKQNLIDPNTVIPGCMPMDTKE